MNRVLLFQHRNFRPAGGAFREFSGGEAPNDELLAFDPVGILGGFAIEVRADCGCSGAFDRDAFDRHSERGSEIFAEAGLLREHVAARGEDERVAVTEDQHR